VLPALHACNCVTEILDDLLQAVPGRSEGVQLCLAEIGMAAAWAATKRIAVCPCGDDDDDDATGRLRCSHRGGEDEKMTGLAFNVPQMRRLASLTHNPLAYGRVVPGSGHIREKGVVVHKEPDRQHHENQDAVHVASVITRSAAKRARWPSLHSGKP